MSAESPAAIFLPLGDLLEEKELMFSNAYNEGYYIRRKFHYQEAIKKDIFNDNM